MLKKTFLAGGVLLLFFVLINTAFSAPLSRGDQGQEIMQQLLEKGIVEGFADGTLKGDRALTRWELAILLARTLGKWEKDCALFMTKSERDALQTLLNSLKEELSAYGLRTDQLEKLIPPLEKRIAELSKIRFYGSLDAIMVTQGFSGKTLIGTMVNGNSDNLATDWFTGRRMGIGTGFTSLALLGIEAQITPKLYLGTDLAGYVSQGDEIVDLYWGVTPPFLSNPFTSVGGMNPTISGTLNTPWTRVNLERIWLKELDSDTLLSIGSFYPQKMVPSLLLGARNPNINAPAVLPFYGVDFNRKINLFAPASLELLYARLPQPTYFYNNTTYNLPAWCAGANLTWQLKKGEFSLNFLRTVNEPFGSDVLQAGGYLIPLPADLQWADARGAVVYRDSVGPQAQNAIGARFSWDFTPKFSTSLEAASSTYDPDTSKINFDQRACGSLFSFKLKGNYRKIDLLGELLTVSPKFDPMVLPYPTPPNIPVFLPYAVYYGNYYQLHDNFEYPNNRQGFRIKASSPIRYGSVNLAMENLSQLKSSNQQEMTSVGNVEPLFPAMSQGEEKGQVKNYALGVAYQIPKSRFKSRLNYQNYQIRRNTPRINDNIDLALNLANVSLEYPCSYKLLLSGGFSWLHYNGYNINQTSQDFIQTIPMLGLVYSPNPRTAIQFSYRLFNFRDRTNTNENWFGTQTILEIKSQL